MRQTQWRSNSYCLPAWRIKSHSMKDIAAQAYQSGALLQVEPAVKRAPLEERKKRKRDDAEGSTQAAAPEGGAQAAAFEGGAQAAAPVAATPPAQRPQRVRTRLPGAAAAKQQLLRTVAVGGLDASSMAAAVAIARAAGKVSLPGVMQLRDPQQLAPWAACHSTLGCHQLCLLYDHLVAMEALTASCINSIIPEIKVCLLIVHLPAEEAPPAPHPRCCCAGGVCGREPSRGGRCEGSPAPGWLHWQHRFCGV